MIKDLYKYILVEMYKFSLTNGNYSDSDFIIKTSNKQTINYKKYNTIMNIKNENTKGIAKYKDQSKKRY